MNWGGKKPIFQFLEWITCHLIPYERGWLKLDDFAFGQDQMLKFACWMLDRMEENG